MIEEAQKELLAIVEENKRLATLSLKIKRVYNLNCKLFLLDVVLIHYKLQYYKSFKLLQY